MNMISKIFDFNIHLPARLIETKSLIESEQNHTEESFYAAYEDRKEDFQNLAGLNLMIFNTRALTDYSQLSEIFNSESQKIMATILFDFRDLQMREALQNNFSPSIKSIKFHSYVQKISETDFNACLEAAKLAEKKNLSICIDTSFGGPWMYDFDNLKLATLIAREIHEVPIILLHSGGARIKEAFLIAASKENVFLETSFSLWYWQASSFEQDLSFALRKLGSHKFLYGSDYPYVSMQDSKKIHEEFFKKYSLRDSDIERILFQNSDELFFS